jgi:pteridine reductase
MQPTLRLTKTALITGAARRVGRAIAYRLHEADFNIVVHYRTSLSAAQDLVARLNQIRGHSAIAVAADLAATEQLTRLVETAHVEWGRLDLVVNNASSFYPTPLGSLTENVWDDLLASNLKGAFFIAQAAIPYLQKHQGNIINITDTHASRPLKGYPIYCIAKAGLEMLTKTLARELAPRIRVNAIAPGAILWPENASKLSPAQQQAILAAIPLGRQGELKEIADAVLFIAESARYMTGEILHLDGGRGLK